jgi:hypothetical protein
MKPQIITGAVLWTPAATHQEIDFSAAPATAAASPVLSFPALIPIDLTETHGLNITPEHLAEMAAAYNPAVEMASLNLDHNWGGPSLGWCDRVWLQDSALWVRYTDLDPATVDLIRTKRYTRRSAEIALSHPITGGWYFTGCALLGNARPAVAGLPPVTLCRPQYVLTTQKEPPVSETDPPPPAPPNPAPATTTQLAALAAAGETELAALKAQVTEGAQAVATLLRQNAELDVDRRLALLGARLTPAMAKLARPLLVELLADRTPATVKLQADPAKPVTDVSIADHILQILAAVPAVEALTAGLLADADPTARAAGALTTEREAELEQKYRFTASWGFR